MPNSISDPHAPRTGQPDPAIDRASFEARFREHFYDPAFDAQRESVDTLAGIAWDAYQAGRKSPRTHPAGPGYADPALPYLDELHVSLNVDENTQVLRLQSGEADGVFEAFSKKRIAGANPWGEGATTLEWQLPSPPPFHQWEQLPKIR